MDTRWIPILIFVMLYAFPTSAQPRELPTDICGADDVVTPTEAIILADMQAIDTGNPYILMDRSSSCRYMIAMFQVATAPDDERLFVAWDVVTGEQLFKYVRPRVTSRETPVFHWNEDETEVLIGTWYDTSYPGFDRATGPYHLWKLDEGMVHIMTCDGTCVTPLFQSVTWDDRRSWLWTTGWSGAIAYDRNTGLAVRSLFNPPWRRGLFEPWEGHKYMFSQDGSRIIIYNITGTVDSLTVWDIDAYTPYVVNVDGFLPGYQWEVDDYIALSPDNHYLAVGFRAIRIWDLQNLEPAYEDRFPLYRHEGPIAKIARLHFVDNTTIETSSAEGTQRWDLHTGELIESDTTEG